MIFPSGKHYRSFELVHGAPDSIIEGDMRQALLTGLMDKATLIIFSIDCCKDLIENLDPISPLVLCALADDASESPKTFYHMVGAGTKPNTPQDPPKSPQ